MRRYKITNKIKWRQFYIRERITKKKQNKEESRRREIIETNSVTCNSHDEKLRA